MFLSNTLLYQKPWENSNRHRLEHEDDHTVAGGDHRGFVGWVFVGYAATQSNAGLSHMDIAKEYKSLLPLPFGERD